MYGYTMNAEFVGDRQTDVNVSEDERDEAQLNQFAYALSPKEIREIFMRMWRHMDSLNDGLTACRLTIVSNFLQPL